jgi:hypothetical protein
MLPKWSSICCSKLQPQNAPQSGAQRQRGEFGVGERDGAAGEQLFARAGVGWDVLEHHRRSGRGRGDAS